MHATRRVGHTSIHGFTVSGASPTLGDPENSATGAPPPSSQRMRSKIVASLCLFLVAACSQSVSTGDPADRAGNAELVTPQVNAVEAFGSYKNTRHAVAVNSCTAALHLSMLAAGIGAGDEVITTPLTFCATVNAVLHTGATPVLADVDPVTGNVDPAEVERKITERTRVILPVHYAGRACDLDVFMGEQIRPDLAGLEDKRAA